MRKQTHIDIRTDDSLRNKLQAIADSQGIKLSDLVRNVLLEFVRQPSDKIQNGVRQSNKNVGQHWLQPDVDGVRTSTSYEPIND